MEKILLSWDLIFDTYMHVGEHNVRTLKFLKPLKTDEAE